MLLTAGQMSDHKGARLILGALLSAATTLIADRGYGSTKCLKARASRPAFLQPKAAKAPLECHESLYRLRHKIENRFVNLKD